MTDGAEPPARRSDVEWVVLDGETVLYDPKANMMHWLNVSAAAVWDACDGTASVDQIVGAIEAEFAGQDDEISRDVPATIERFRRSGLLRTRPPDAADR